MASQITAVSVEDYLKPFSDPIMGLLPGGEGGLPIMAYTGNLCLKRVPFSGFRYKKEKRFHKLRYVKG